MSQNKFPGNVPVFMLASSSQRQKIEVGQIKIAAWKGTVIEGILNDINSFNNYFQKHLDKTLVHSSIKNGLEKQKDINQEIQKFFKRIITKGYFFYTGHGNKQTGDLQVETKQNKQGYQITLDDLISMWRKHGLTGKKEPRPHLYIFLDSCFSGKWCTKLLQKNQTTISIFASCGQFQPSKSFLGGGLFFNIIFRPSGEFDELYYQLHQYHKNPCFTARGNQFGYYNQQILRKLNENLYEADKIQGQPKFQFSFQIDKCPTQGKHEYTYVISGEKYDGYWKDKKKHGKGKCTYLDGAVYDGQWANDQRNGEGTITFQSGVTFKGKWKDDLPLKGVLDSGNGWIYNGQFKDGVKHGYGEQTRILFKRKGTWENGEIVKQDWRQELVFTD